MFYCFSICNRFFLPSPTICVGLGFWKFDLIFSIAGLFPCLPPNTQLGCIFIHLLCSRLVCLLVSWLFSSYFHCFVSFGRHLSSCLLWLCFFCVFPFQVLFSVLYLRFYVGLCIAFSKLMVLFELALSFVFYSLWDFPVFM